MISASPAFIQRVNNGDIPHVRMQLTTASGRVVWLEDGDFWGDTVTFSEATSNDGEFKFGSAVIGGFNFGLTNFYRSLDDVDFSGAVCIPFLYYDINGTKEYLPKGVYYVNSHVTSGNVVRCTALDGLKLFDQSQTEITFPIKFKDLVSRLCQANGITLATENPKNGDFQLPNPKLNDGTVLTDRQMLSYACEVTGNFARMDEQGRLAIGWYDFENAYNVTATFDGKSLWTKPISVTGIRIDAGSGSGALMAMSVDPNGNLIYMRSSQVSDTFTLNDRGELIAHVESGATYSIVDGALMRTGEELLPESSETHPNDNISILYGSDDYVVDIMENPFVDISNIRQICEMVSKSIFDVGFRPGTLPVLSHPCLQAGDVLHVTDNITGKDYYFPITTLSYTRQIIENLTCAFKTKEDSDLRPSNSYTMRRDVNAALEQAKTADDLAQAAQEMAEKSGYQLTVVSDKGSAFNQNTTANLTGTIYDRDMNLIDPEGTEMVIRWWVAQDSNSATYLNGGKTITVAVDDSLCDYSAGIWFETMPLSEVGYDPFMLSTRNELVLTTRDGVPLTVRAAERYDV